MVKGVNVQKRKDFLGLNDGLVEILGAVRQGCLPP